MYMRDKLSFHEIAKRTGLARNTVRTWLRDAVQGAPPKYKVRVVGFSKLAPFVAELKQALKADSFRRKRERRAGRALFNQIKTQGYQGGYTRVTDFIRAWRGGESRNVTAFVPLQFEPGEAFQFDWSTEGLVIGGIYRKIDLSHMKLCFSRAFWLVAFPSQGHEMLFEAHTRSFEAFVGVPRRGIYDNMKTAVDKVKKGKGRKVNSRFAVMCGHYLFDADFCNVASGWEKGVVEKNVQDSRRRVWIEAKARRFGSFTELNVWLAGRCKALWAEVRHPEHREFSVLEMLEQERAEMMPMPTAFDGYVEKPAKASSTCLVAIDRNRYSLPCEYAGKRVSSRLYAYHVAVAIVDKIVASHARLAGRGQVNYDWQHYIALIQRKPGALRNGAPFADMPEPLLKLRLGLMRHEGGDKAMAEVLHGVTTHGLEAVLVAVELVIETGVLSIENVLNFVARLSEKAPPPNVENSLRLEELPMANTSRYDGLRIDAELQVQA